MQVSDQIHAFMWRSMTSNNCNAYLIDGPARILIDPGHTRHFDHVQSGLAALNLTIAEIDLVICTHSHGDHLEAAQYFTRLPALFALHEVDWELVAGAKQHAVRPHGTGTGELAPDFFLKEGELKVKGLGLEIIHCPGHSPGSISVYWPEQKAIFTGDLVFKDGVGRTDLPRGDGQGLKESIKRVSALDIDVMLPGHGDMVSEKEEVQSNFQQVEAYWFGLL